MFGQLFCRFVYTTAYRLNSTVPKASLSALRKKTGYSFVNCKKALQQFDNDLEKAEEWLHAEAEKQGWQKVEKLKGRETKQGLIGFLKHGNVASIVEINCETDFAAKSSQFKDLMKDVLNICHNQASSKELGDSLTKLNFSSAELNSLPWQEGKTLADRLALSVTKIGENLNARRALCVKFKDDLFVTGYAHPANSDTGENSIQTGKYVGLVMYRKLSDVAPSFDFDKSLCQHIIGMDPKEIGEMETTEETQIKDVESMKDEVVESITKKNNLEDLSPKKEEMEDISSSKKEKIEDTSSRKEEIEDTSSRKEEIEDTSPKKEEIEDTSSKKEEIEDTSSSSESSSDDDDDFDHEMFEEKSLLKQKFIADPDKTVGEILEEATVQVVDFVRFECGQILEENKT